MKKLIFSLATMIICVHVVGQQISVSRLHMDNKYSFNPAVAGSMDYNPIVVGYRQAWTGIDEAPLLKTVSGHFALSETMGVGAKYFQEEKGLEMKTGIEGSYAYHFQVGASGSKLALGLSAMLYQYQLNISEINMKEEVDPVIQNAASKLIVPDVTFGAYFYHDSYYVGLAVPQLLNRKVDLTSIDSIEQRQARHYFLNAGYLYDVDDDFSVEPSLLIKLIEQGQTQFSVNMKVIYQKMLWAGFSYNSKDAVVAMFGVNVDRIAFGYAYDITLSDIKTVSNGSHELMLIYKFVNSEPKL